MKRFIFPDPLDATCKLQPDSMAQPIVGVADTHPVNGAPCQSFNVPSTVPDQNGATLTIQKSGFIPVVLHGILDTVTPGGPLARTTTCHGGCRRGATRDRSAAGSGAR